MPYETMPAKTTNRVLSGEAADFLVRMTVDARKEVHTEAFASLKHKKVPIEKAEVDLLVKNLHRVAATFRKGAIERLAKLKPDERLAVAERLLGDTHAKRRAAGLELCATLIEVGAKADEGRALIKAHEAEHGRLLRAVDPRQPGEGDRAEVCGCCQGHHGGARLPELAC
jgi:hypothetical protein